MKKSASLLSAILFALVSALSFAQAPVPFINLPLVPDATPPGGSDFTLTINGTGFVSNSVVNWNGTPLVTQFVSGSQLTATVPAADIATASTAWVTVVNPGPGAVKSNTAYFSVTPDAGDSVAFMLYSSVVYDQWPASIAVGDFNGDGNLDLAGSDIWDINVSIFLGDGKGNFTLVSSIPTGSTHQDHSVAVGDFNEDGKIDLAVVNRWTYNVSILLGDGTGNFTPFSYPFAYNPFTVAVGDFNGDGHLDLATAGDDDAVAILLGDGTGNFTPGPLLPAGAWDWDIAIGDFNRDGKLDLVTADYRNNTVCILLGDGTGNFTLTSVLPAGNTPTSVAVGDFNGDGNLDLAVGNDGSATVSILLGDGTGNFTLASSAVGTAPWGVALGDFNGDSKLDLAVANLGNSTAYVELGDGNGNFHLVSNLGLGDWGTAYSAAVGDFNGDGKMDFVTGGRYLSVVLGVPANTAVTVSPTSLTFGTHLVGTSSAPHPVTLTNTGNAPLDITSIVASRNFLQQNDCGSQLLPGANCTIEVTFRPRQIGQINGTITVIDNAPNSPQTVSLSGVGTAVTLLPSHLNFGNVQVGTTSPPQIVTLTNHSVKDLRIFGAYLQGNNRGAFAQTNTCEPIVPAGGSCTISVTFTPHSKGAKTATGYVEDNGGASPQSVALSGNGT